MAEDKKGAVEGQQGFDKKEQKENPDIINKEETMFKVDAEGIAIPEKWPVKIYDRDLDKELISESLTLLEVIKKQKAISKVMGDAKAKDAVEMGQLKKKFEDEVDTDKKMKLKLEFDLATTRQTKGEIAAATNTEVVNLAVQESREIIRGLNAEKEKQTKTSHAMVQPCNTSESFMAFEKGKTVEGKDTDDWVADLISKRVKDPTYTFEEAKQLRPDWKVGFKEAIMEASNYKVKGYRDVMMDVKLAAEKPLVIKKE